MPALRTDGGRVAIVDTADTTGVELLRAALDRAGVWESLRVVSQGRDPQRVRVAIAPDLSAFAAHSPAATDPALVEALIDWLAERGYPAVEVAASRDSSALWAENRDVNVMADLIGYRFSTPSGHPYEITDLTRETPTPPPPDGALLAREEIGAAWADADFRIVFARNKTDDHSGYALCLESLLGVLALEDKDYLYRQRSDRAAVVCEILRHAPPHAAIIDATVSAHGSGGARRPRAITTGTIIAASSAVLADYVGALKMGLDPAVSPIAQRIFEQAGPPTRYEVDGSLATYPGWRNPHPLLLDSTRRRERWTQVSRTVAPWLQETDAAIFPLKRVLDARANAMVSSLLAGADDEQGASWALVAANYLIDGVARATHAYQVMYDKDAVRRHVVALNVDAAAFAPADYAGLAGELRDLTALLQPLEPRQGLRWRYLDRAVIFEASTSYPIPFDDFVGAVDVTKTIQYMNDYIGGVAVPVARDAAGRVIHQIERNVYLPQPNYVILYSGDVIDVTKLEYAEYAPDAHRMYWKTIKSENASARFDDGTVAFERSAEGTRVTICGRQQFALPPVLEMAQLDLNPAWKAHLVTHAYATFFQRTFANLEAVTEGRDVHIGRRWQQPSDAEGTEPMPAVRIEAALMSLAERVGEWTREAAAGQAPRAAALVDADGFAHFTASAAQATPAPSPLGAVIQRSADAWSDLAQAMMRDGRSRTRAGA